MGQLPSAHHVEISRSLNQNCPVAYRFKENDCIDCLLLALCELIMVIAQKINSISVYLQEDYYTCTSMKVDKELFISKCIGHLSVLWVRG